MRAFLIALLLVTAAVRPAPAALLAAVEFGWSPFAREPAPAGVAALVAEARALMATDPARVAQILETSPPSGPGARMRTGLRADARYLAGGDGILEAQRLYRVLLSGEGTPAEIAWSHFMLGNIHKGLGFLAEAETEYRSARAAAAGAEEWRPALDFDLAALQVETGRFADARDALEAWLDAHGDLPGRPLVLYLLGECEVSLGHDRQAEARFAAARALDAEAWLVRPATGYALADLLERQGKAQDAVALLELLAERRPGTRDGARARLRVGRIWQEAGEVARAARSYARLLDLGATPEEGREATLRLALLGVEFADRVELTEPLPAYRYFYRPRPTLEEVAAGRDPAAAQRALVGLAGLARRDGDPSGALATLARTFQEYPESAESGRAYEAFMELLAARLDELQRGGAYADVVETYQAFVGAMAWVPNRDVGALALRTADAYEALGAPAMAAELCRETLTRGTRAVEPDALRARILRLQAATGDLEALTRRAGARPRDWQARLALARGLAADGQDERARQAYAEAARAAPGPTERLRILAERDRLGLPGEDAASLLEHLRALRAVWEELPDGPDRKEWEVHGERVGARLDFALGRYAEAARVFAGLADREPADTYLWAVAERRSGHPARAKELFAALAAKEEEEPFSDLAGTYRELAALAGAPESR